jgi:hypothetical protein
VPTNVADPVHVASVIVLPENVSWPLSEAPSSFAVTSPDQSTEVPFHVPVISDPFCVSVTDTCSGELFDDVNEPFQLPEISGSVPIDEGVVLEPEHADDSRTA